MNTLTFEQDLRMRAMGRRPSAPEVWFSQPTRGVQTSTLQFGEFQRTIVTTSNAAAVPGKGGLHAKGSDADGDGKTGEGKKKIKDFSDKDGNGKPDVFDSSSDSSSSYESSSEDEGKMTKSKSNASAGDDCGCGCEGDPAKKKKDCDGDKLKKTISKASAKEGRKKKVKHPDEGSSA
jgi:hypothetical protein